MTSSNGNISALLALCAGNSPVPVNSPHKGQWRGALMFSLIYAWINDWVNNREAGDLRRQRNHYDVIVMGWTKDGTSMVCNQTTIWLKCFTPCPPPKLLTYKSLDRIYLHLSYILFRVKIHIPWDDNEIGFRDGHFTYMNTGPRRNFALRRNISLWWSQF